VHRYDLLNTNGVLVNTLMNLRFNKIQRRTFALWSYLIAFVKTKKLTRNKVAWVVIPCGSKRARIFGGTYCLHLQGLRVGQAGNQENQAAS
jgi:hypothetical protein